MHDLNFDEIWQIIFLNENKHWKSNMKVDDNLEKGKFRMILFLFSNPLPYGYNQKEENTR